jgi:hypothetical protein
VGKKRLQVLCRICGKVCNHLSGLCKAHRDPRGDNVWLTDADRAYLEWKRQKDGAQLTEGHPRRASNQAAIDAELPTIDDVRGILKD